MSVYFFSIAFPVKSRQMLAELQENLLIVRAVTLGSISRGKGSSFTGGLQLEALKSFQKHLKLTWRHIHYNPLYSQTLQFLVTTRLHKPYSACCGHINVKWYFAVEWQFLPCVHSQMQERCTTHSWNMKVCLKHADIFPR